MASTPSYSSASAAVTSISSSLSVNFIVPPPFDREFYLKYSTGERGKAKLLHIHRACPRPLVIPEHGGPPDPEEKGLVARDAEELFDDVLDAGLHLLRVAQDDLQASAILRPDRFDTRPDVLLLPVSRDNDGRQGEKIYNLLFQLLRVRCRSLDLIDISADAARKGRRFFRDDPGFEYPDALGQG